MVPPDCPRSSRYRALALFVALLGATIVGSGCTTMERVGKIVADEFAEQVPVLTAEVTTRVLSGMDVGEAFETVFRDHGPDIVGGILTNVLPAEVDKAVGPAVEKVLDGEFSKDKILRVLIEDGPTVFASSMTELVANATDATPADREFLSEEFTKLGELFQKTAHVNPETGEVSASDDWPTLLALAVPSIFALWVRWRQKKDVSALAERNAQSDARKTAAEQDIAQIKGALSALAPKTGAS